MNNFSRDLHTILVLLREHQEWRYSYPEKFDSVRTTVIHQFIDLLSRTSGMRLTHRYLDIPVENIRQPGKTETLRLVKKVTRQLGMYIRKCESSTKKAYIVRILANWQAVYEILEKKNDL